MTGYPAILRFASAVVCVTSMAGVAVAQDKYKAPAAPAPGKDTKAMPAPAAPAKDAMAMGPQHVVYNMNGLKWGDAPPSLPKGAKVAVLNGDPGKPAPFAIMIKLPANYKVPAHWHSQDENLTVISGELSVGMGDKLDEKSADAIHSGGYSFMPAKMHHYAFAKKETVFELHGSGPFDVTYINPADDPRNAAPAAAPKKEEKKK